MRFRGLFLVGFNRTDCLMQGLKPVKAQRRCNGCRGKHCRDDLHEIRGADEEGLETLDQP